MKHAIQTTALLLLGASLAGCDAGKDPFARAAQAEASGDVNAATLYREVCTKAAASPLCPVATVRAERLQIKAAWKLLDEGKHAEARKALSAPFTDAAVKRAAAAALADPELEAGARWEAAQAMTDAQAAQAEMTALAALPASVAPQARAWLAQRRPAQLLAQLKAACLPTGTGSCHDLGKQLKLLPAGSPERTQGQALVDAEYARVYPILKKAESLLVQRLEVFDKAAKYERCVSEAGADDDSAKSACAERLSVNLTLKTPFPIGPIVDLWEKRLAEIHDPGLISALKARWDRVDSAGEYDPGPWPKPAEAARLACHDPL